VRSSRRGSRLIPKPERVMIALSTPMHERLRDEAERLNQTLSAVARAHIARSIEREDVREKASA
jgi:predicted transcriptional regulator